MQTALILQSPSLTDRNSNVLAHFNLPAPVAGNNSLRLAVDSALTLPAGEKEVLARQKIDHAILPDIAFEDLGLIVSDMDSALITIECVDEIAAGVGLKDKVAEITERSMCGGLDFERSLRSRVALLEGLDSRVLEGVYENVLQLSPDAEFLLDERKKHNVKLMLVSDGFTPFIERLQQHLGFEYHYANVLEIKNGRLTGRLKGKIIDAQAKAGLLRKYRNRLGLQPHQVLTMGNGANDIPTLKEAGIDIAYRAKPRTQANADARINFGGLERMRGWFR